MKKFLIIGNINAVVCKDVFPYVKVNEVRLGYINNAPMTFIAPDDCEKYNEIIDGIKYVKINSISWFTSLNTDWNSEIELTESYLEHPEQYPKYDNYDAIEVSRVKDIPCDYDGVMGVPITFLCKYNPDQFEILGCDKRHCHNDFPDTKKYDAYKEIRQDGTLTGCSGKKINEQSIIAGKPEKGNYFINDEGREVYSKYNRLFIKRVNEDGTIDWLKNDYAGDT